MAVSPITPPVPAMASASRSLMARMLGFSAAMLVWVATTGTAARDRERIETGLFGTVLGTTSRNQVDAAESALRVHVPLETAR